MRPSNHQVRALGAALVALHRAQLPPSEAGLCASRDHDDQARTLLGLLDAAGYRLKPRRSQ